MEYFMIRVETTQVSPANAFAFWFQCRKTQLLRMKPWFYFELLSYVCHLAIGGHWALCLIFSTHLW